MYIKRQGTESLLVGVYVDDLIVTGTKLLNIVKFKGEMKSEFDMSELGLLLYYLGLEVAQGHGVVKICQASYAKKVLERAGMIDCSTVKYPMEYKLNIHVDQMGKAVNPTFFKSIIGGLRYLVHTRPDIAYAVGIG